MDAFILLCIGAFSSVQVFVPNIIWFSNFLTNNSHFSNYFSQENFDVINLIIWGISFLFTFIAVFTLFITTSSKHKLLFWNLSYLPDATILTISDIIFKAVTLILMDIIIAILPFWTFVTKAGVMIMVSLVIILWGSQNIIVPINKWTKHFQHGNYSHLVSSIALSYSKELLLTLPFCVQVFMMAETVFRIIWSLILSFG